jgi:hypothetical protein
MVASLLDHARRAIAITRTSPLEIAREGDLQRAWELADLWAAEERVLWHLLLAWGADAPSHAAIVRRQDGTVARSPDYSLLLWGK